MKKEYRELLIDLGYLILMGCIFTLEIVLFVNLLFPDLIESFPPFANPFVYVELGFLFSCVARYRDYEEREKARVDV